MTGTIAVVAAGGMLIAAIGFWRAARQLADQVQGYLAVAELEHQAAERDKRDAQAILEEALV